MKRQRTSRFARLHLTVAVLLLSAAGLAFALRPDTNATTPEDASQRTQPLRLHPDNPHYFLFRSQPAVLITSAEHYGAVINPDFDYIAYLDKLHESGFNLTRIFTGAHVEAADFTVLGHYNTLAPRPSRVLAPWARSQTPGYFYGGPKFDLTRWDPDYFSRLRDFIAEAGLRGIVVELTLFSPSYTESNWRASPFNYINNVNNAGEIPISQVHKLDNGGLLRFQDALVQKIVRETNEYDNVYYEVVNEPFWNNEVADEWQNHIIGTIVNAEQHLRYKHLIAQNSAAHSAKIADPNPAVSIFNFHVAIPDAVTSNYNLGKAIADDETGFKGLDAAPYRIEAWDFILAGGSVFNYLDWSFAPDHERGTLVVPPNHSSGGGETLRLQIHALKEFIESFEFIRMRPDESVVLGGVPADATVRALAERGQTYAIYLNGGQQANLELDLAPGSYRADWIKPEAGTVEKRETFTHAGGARTVSSPPYEQDIALRIRRV
ncbi:MAG: putative collagen-binding domain-containing protein [Acidimicrobiia bacterium]